MGEFTVAGQKQLRSVDSEAAPAAPLGLRGALAYTFDGILTMNSAGVIKQANHSACGILGHPPDLLIGRRVQEFVQVRRTSVPIDIFAAPQGHGSHQTAFTLKRRNNSAVDVLVRECHGEVPDERLWILRELAPDGLVIEALERQSRLLLEAQRVGRTGAWELDIKTGRLIWTLELRRIMELPDTNEEMTIERSFNFYSATSEAIVREAFDATVTRGIPYDLELEVVTRARQPHLGSGSLPRHDSPGPADFDDRRVAGHYRAAAPCRLPCAFRGPGARARRGGSA